MTNFERYKDKIREIASRENDLAMENGVLKPCGDIDDCEYCDFYDVGLSCGGKALAWLLADDGTPSAERLAGQNEAWELARKIVMSESRGGYNGKQINEIFKNYWNANDIMFDHSYAEAAEKVKAWEESKEIKVGDVVKFNKMREGEVGVVTYIDAAEICVIDKDGFVRVWFRSECTKTGRTLPVSDWLRQIGGEDATV